MLQEPTCFEAWSLLPKRVGGREWEATYITFSVKQIILAKLVSLREDRTILLNSICTAGQSLSLGVISRSSQQQDYFFPMTPCQEKKKKHFNLPWPLWLVVNHKLACPVQHFAFNFTSDSKWLVEASESQLWNGDKMFTLLMLNSLLTVLNV